MTILCNWHYYYPMPTTVIDSGSHSALWTTVTLKYGLICVEFKQGSRTIFIQNQDLVKALPHGELALLGSKLMSVAMPNSTRFILGPQQLGLLVHEAQNGASAEDLLGLLLVWSHVPKVPFLTALPLSRTDWFDPFDTFTPPVFFGCDSEALRTVARLVVAYCHEEDVYAVDANLPVRSEPLFKLAFTAETRRMWLEDPKFQSFMSAFNVKHFMAYEALLNQLRLPDARVFFAYSLHRRGVTDAATLLSLTVEEDRLIKYPPGTLARLEDLPSIAVGTELVSYVMRVFRSDETLRSDVVARGLSLNSLKTLLRSEGELAFNPETLLINRLIRILGTQEGVLLYYELLESDAALDLKLAYIRDLNESSPPFGWIEALG